VSVGDGVNGKDMKIVHDSCHLDIPDVSGPNFFVVQGGYYIHPQVSNSLKSISVIFCQKINADSSIVLQLMQTPLFSCNDLKIIPR